MPRINGQEEDQGRQAIITLPNKPLNHKEAYKEQESMIIHLLTKKRGLGFVKSSQKGKGHWMFRSNTKKNMESNQKETLTETKFRSLVMKNKSFQIDNQTNQNTRSKASTLDKSHIGKQCGTHNLKKTGFGTLFDIDNRRFRIIKQNSPSPHSYQQSTYKKTPKKRQRIQIRQMKAQQNKKNGGPGPGTYNSEAEFRKDDRKILKKVRLEKLQKYHELCSLSKTNKQNCLINTEIKNRMEIRQQKTPHSHGYSFPKSGKSGSQELLRTQLTKITKQYLQQPYTKNKYNDWGLQKSGDLHSRMFSNAFLQKNDHAYEIYLDPKVLRQQQAQSDYIFIPGKKQPTINRNSSPFLSKTIRNVF